VPPIPARVTRFPRTFHLRPDGVSGATSTGRVVDRRYDWLPQATVIESVRGASSVDTWRTHNATKAGFDKLVISGFFIFNFKNTRHDLIPKTKVSLHFRRGRES